MNKKIKHVCFKKIKHNTKIKLIKLGLLETEIKKNAKP